MYEFEKEFSLERRKEEAEKILKKYTNKVPVIVEYQVGCSLPPLDRKKFLVPADLTIAQFIHILRKRIKLASEEAIFIFTNNTIPLASRLISEVYKENKHIDGFLYILVNNMEVYG